MRSRNQCMGFLPQHIIVCSEYPASRLPPECCQHLLSLPGNASTTLGFAATGRLNVSVLFLDRGHVLDGKLSTALEVLGLVAVLGPVGLGCRVPSTALFACILSTEGLPTRRASSIMSTTWRSKCTETDTSGNTDAHLLSGREGTPSRKSLRRSWSVYGRCHAPNGASKIPFPVVGLFRCHARPRHSICTAGPGDIDYDESWGRDVGRFMDVASRAKICF